VNFAVTQATNVSLVYTIDAYRPVAGEIVVTQLGFKGESTMNSQFAHKLTASSGLRFLAVFLH
jgi:hypothetical protein